MEEMETKVYIKPELKEEDVLPLIESGMDIDNIMTTIKKEDEDFTEALVKVTKKEEFQVKYDDETKPTITSLLVKSCSELDTKYNQDDIKIFKGKSEAENNKKESSNDEISNEADFEKMSEDILLEKNESDGAEEDFRGISSSQTIIIRPSSLLQLNPVCSTKKYVKEKKHTHKGIAGSDISRRYIPTHSSKKLYSCSFCYKRFKTKPLLKCHSLIHTDKEFLCSVCSKHLCSLESLKIHMLAHEEKTCFKCAHCPLDFSQKSDIRHTKRAHEQEEEERTLDACSDNLELEHSMDHVENCDINNYKWHDCENTFKSRNNLVDHTKDLHSTDNVTCHDCGKTFKHKDHIIEHMKKIHNQEKKYKCQICGMACSTKSNLKKHEGLHKNVYPHKCKYCNISFKEKIGLKSHFLNMHESIKLYQCAECDQSFKMKNNLVSHIEVHHTTTDKMFSCHICKMEFKRKCYLNRHVETHTDADKKYICNDCGLGCRSKTDITKHVLTHIGAVEKPFTCEVCGMCFGKKSHLVRHSRVHSDRKTFTCDLCEKAYKDPYSLREHHESVHLKLEFSCNTCGFKSTNSRSFKRHLRQRHD